MIVEFQGFSMLKPLQDCVEIPHAAYWSDDCFKEEKKTIFKDFTCPATTDLFQKTNDFVVCDWAEKSMVLQNTVAGLKCFSNYCTHRFSRLQEGEGNRALLCRYHAWMFDENGSPRCPVESAKSLQQYQVQTSGRFVFTAQDTQKKFDHYLEDDRFKSMLEVISENMGDRIETFDIEIHANWKIVVENTLEAYHIKSVHPHTFAKAGLSSEIRFNHSASHSDMLIARDTNNLKREKLNEILEDRSWKPDGFFHALYFPNLSIGSLFGLTTYVGHIIPVNPRKTIFRYRLFHCKITNPTKQTESAQKLIAQSASLFTKQTLLEDRAVCESVQRGIEELKGSLVGCLLPQEIRIKYFRDAYAQRMQKMESW